MPKPKHSIIKPSYVIYDTCNDEFASPLCTTMDELRGHLSDLDNEASEGDYIILKVVESDIELSKGGWTLDN